MRKILSIVLVITFLLTFSTSALAYDASDKIATKRNVTGIVRESGTQTPVVSKSEFNYTLSEIKLSVKDNSASIQAILNNQQITFGVRQGTVPRLGNNW
jgi:hypothetical protein